MSSKPKILMSIFTVEGNIGSGKTTLISELQNYKFIFKFDGHDSVLHVFSKVKVTLKLSKEDKYF